MTKPTVGFFGLTGCAGCLLSFVFNEDDLLDMIDAVNLTAFPFISEMKKEPDKFDVVFVEGSVVSTHDLETIKRLREKSKLIIAFGACACTGGVPTYLHFSNQRSYKRLQYDKIKIIRPTKEGPAPLEEHVKVDFFIPGCPPEKEDLKRFIKNLLISKHPIQDDKPVCYECKLNKNSCLLVKGKPCLGPYTKGGCDSICINGGMECWGCRGPTTNITLDIKNAHKFNVWKCDPKLVKDRLKTFAGLQFGFKRKD